MKEIELSIVIPIYNEEENVSLLHKKLTEVLKLMNKSYELLFIDDGSSDG
ncbi:MAG: glycosyltransferase, partial [Nanoarchaeota archaeon]|nr:glycosyltransferase [Nanoarchaeota archaeon]